MDWLGAFWTRKIDKVAKQGVCRGFFRQFKFKVQQGDQEVVD